LYDGVLVLLTFHDFPTPAFVRADATNVSRFGYGGG